MPHLNLLTQTALPTIEIAYQETHLQNRSSIAPLEFSAFTAPEVSRLRFDSVGATGCSVLLFGGDPNYLPLPSNTTRANLRTDFLPPGYYGWKVTCQSAVGTINEVTAFGYLSGV